MSKRKQDDSVSLLPDKKSKSNAENENPRGPTFVVTVLNESIHGMQEWTEEETALLKQAVDTDGGQFNWDVIASAVPSKDINQVKTYVLSMISQQTENQNNQAANVIKAPIEIWTDLAQKLTSDEDKAAAVCIPQLMVAAAAEPINAHEPGKPNYSQIYLYLSSLLKGETPQALPPLESSVVLSLIQQIVSKIRASDLSGQMHFLATTYKSLQSNDLEQNKIDTNTQQNTSSRSTAGAEAGTGAAAGTGTGAIKRTSSGRIIRQRVQLELDSDVDDDDDEDETEQGEETTSTSRPRPTSLNPFRIPVNLLNFKARTKP